MYVFHRFHGFLYANTDFMRKQQGNEEVKSMHNKLYLFLYEDKKRLYYLFINESFF